MSGEGETDRQLVCLLKQLLRENETNDDEECTGDGDNSPAQVVNQVFTPEETRSRVATDGVVDALSAFKSPVRATTAQFVPSCITIRLSVIRAQDQH